MKTITASLPLTLDAYVWSEDRTNTWVSIEFATAHLQHGTCSTLVHFNRRNHKARAASFCAAVAREFRTPTDAIRALAAAELEWSPRSGGIGLQFIDSLVEAAAPTLLS